MLPPILFVLRSVSHGGAEQHVLNLMQGLRGQGLTCIYAGPANGWLARTAEDQGFECLPLSMRGTYDVVSVVRLANFVKRRGVGLLHGHLARGSFYAGVASKLTSVPCLASVHATTLSRHYRWPSHLVAVSNAVRESLLSQGYEGRKISRIYLGIKDRAEEELESQQRRRITDNNKPVIFAMAARFLADKGQDIAIRALAHCKGINWQLKLAGDSNNAWGEVVKQLVAELGLRDRVQFVGHCSDMAAFYRGVDIIVAPSRREALSLTLIEAAMRGLPVVASRVGGIPEVVVHGQTGLLVPSGDIEGFADAFCSLGSSATLCNDFGKKARDQYLEYFTQETMVSAMIDLYQKLLGGFKD
jgi:glycosyltransferase involved in cell wall biosynthesis